MNNDLTEEEQAVIRAAQEECRALEAEVAKLSDAEVEARLAQLPDHWEKAVQVAVGEVDRRSLLVDIYFCDEDARQDNDKR